MSSRLIENRGEKWRKDDVFWGRKGPNNKGKLLGIHNGTETDFRMQQGVYALYDKDGVLLYVGRAVSHSLFNRLWSHCKNPTLGDFTHFSWWGFRYVRENGELSNPAEQRQIEVQTLIKHLEAVVIAAAVPRHCEISGDFAGVEKYHQVRDDRLGAAGVQPPDPRIEAGDEEVQAEEKGEPASELAQVAEAEVAAGDPRLRRWPIIAFAVLGWLVALVLFAANRALGSPQIGG